MFVSAFDLTEHQFKARLQRKNRLFAEKESIVCRERRRSCSLVVKKFNAVKKKSRMKRLGFFFRYLLKIKIRTS
jgi:hypothetical protein